MNKTNKANPSINWPEHGKLFTTNDLFLANPSEKQITLRVRLDNAKRDKIVSLIGYKNMGKGRPIMILAMNPVSQELLDKAYAEGIQPPEIKPIINIMSISNVTASTTETKIPTIPVSINTEKVLS